MARPQKDGIDYFPLDTDFFRADKRIRSLLIKYGTDGISLLLYLYCDIYANGYYVVVDEDYIQAAVRELGMNENTIRQVLNYLLERSLFSDTLFQSVKVLTSPGIQRRFMMAVKERVRKRRTPVIVEQDYWMVPESEIETVSIKSGSDTSLLKVIQFSVSPRNNPIVPRNNSSSSTEQSPKESKEKESKEKYRSKSVRGGLTREEEDALVKEFGKPLVEEYIKRTGEYHCCNAVTIRNWILDDQAKQKSRKEGKPQKQNQFNFFPQRQYGEDIYTDMERKLLKKGGTDAGAGTEAEPMDQICNGAHGD